MQKVAIVNRTNLLNFGSVLQVLGLSKAVETLGFESFVIWEGGTVTRNFDLRPQKILSICFKLIRYPQFIKSSLKDLKTVAGAGNNYTENTRLLFKSFVEANIKTKFYSPKEIKEVGKSSLYYKYICGSDQIWCSTTLYPDPLMYLRFARRERRIAYAPSLGRSYIPDYNKKTLKKYISDIPFVSIRESEGALLLKDLLYKDYPVVLDPTLLFDRSFWQAYSSPVKDSDYILCYFLNEPSESVQNEMLAYANGKKIIALRSKLNYLASDYSNILYPEAGPAEFIGYIANADFIFTDSYHGMLFSIIFEKEFLSVEREYGTFDQSTRQKSILDQLGIKNHYNKTGKSNSSSIDYSKVNNIISELRKGAFAFLKSALESNQGL